MSEIEKLPSVEIKETSDGSSTFYVPALDEHYHSVHGAMTESLHVFIRPGLEMCEKANVRILEVGFGTGLNALLTLVHRKTKQVVYHSLELFPLPSELTDQLNFNVVAKEAEGGLKKIHAAKWNTEVAIEAGFVLKKIEADLLDWEGEGGYDIVYFDAFAPEKQGGMWSREVFEKLYRLMSHGGVLCTYCAKGVVRRTMQEVGFQVMRLPGPPGKREMLKAVKSEI